MLRKTFWAACLTLLAVTFFNSPLLADNEHQQEKSATGEVRVYEIFGMGCPACHGGLTKLLNKIEGVKESEANWKEQWVAVTFMAGAEVDDEEIFEAVKKANFTPGKRIDKVDNGGGS